MGPRFFAALVACIALDVDTEECHIFEFASLESMASESRRAVGTQFPEEPVEEQLQRADASPRET